MPRRNPTVEYTPLEVDGQTLHLVYDFNAIADAEEVAKCNLLQGLAQILIHGMAAAHLRGLLYAALRRAQPKITIEEAGALIRIDTMPGIRDALLRAYNASMPESKRFLDPPEGALPAAAPEN